MRLVLAIVLAALAALPLSASAQGGDEDATTEPNLQESASSSEPAPEEGGLSPRVRKRTRKKWDPQTYDVPASRRSPEEPALQLQLDETGVGVVPSPPQTFDGYTLEEMELRVKRARIGLIVSAGVYVAAIVTWVADPNTSGDSTSGFELAGFALWAGGTVGMIACGALLGVRKRKLRRLKEAHYGNPRRVQWDLARSRLVF